MTKTFRAWTIDQPLLLPVTVQDFVALDHLARFVLGLVRDEIELKQIIGTYGSEKGQPPFHPVMMVALLLYAYTQGIYASRRIEKACRERVDFMCIVGLDAPNFRTIADFRKRHLKALEALFVQILLLCQKAGLVKLGHVALDGTKVKANASKHKAMSYERMEQRAAELEAEVARWLAAAEAADAADDKQHGPDRSGEEMPDWVADKKRRAERIRKAKAELEAEARAAAEAKATARAKAAAEAKATDGHKPGDHNEPEPPASPPPASPPPASPPPEAKPAPKAQKNFTDPESRIMKSKDGFVQAYNAQIAVDAHAQIIVAQAVVQSAADSGQLLPMIDAVVANLGARPEQASADAGYCSDANLKGLAARNIDGYVATGRARDAATGEVGAAAEAKGATPSSSGPVPAPERIGPPTRVEAMREKIRAGGHDSPYRLRKQLPEPVFGQIKQARGFRQFLLRGLTRVAGEWSLVCSAHNLLKLAQGRTLSAARSTTEDAAATAP